MSEFVREPRHVYQDPLARVWLHCARRAGFRVVRSADVYASTDGRGTLIIADDILFDPDDNLAQMIFHELCHALVEGEDGERQPDWGLDNTRMGNPWREQGCLRLQAWLAESVGLRDFLAPTTDFRVTFWDSLPADPFAAPAEAGGRRERSCVAGRRGLWRASQPRWAEPLREALQATARMAAIVNTLPGSADAGAGGTAAPGSSAGLPSLWETAVPPPAPHPAGHAPVAGYLAESHCQDCAWAFRSRNTWRCRHAPGRSLPDNAPACMRFEPAADLDCQTCGACCREAYDSVEVSRRDPVNRLHPELIRIETTHRKLRREGDRCAALQGGTLPTEAYGCAIYPDRPRACREFERGSAHCLEARRRVGLSL